MAPPLTGRPGKLPILPSKLIPGGLSGPNAGGVVVPSTSGEPSPNTISNDERRLNTAYTMYLQQKLLNNLVTDSERFQAMTAEDECTKTFLATNFVNGFVAMNKEISQYQLMILYLEHLLLTNEFLGLYKSVVDKFKEQACTLEELQRALESRFNELELKDLKLNSKDEEDCNGNGNHGQTECTVDELISKVKDALVPQVPPQDGKSFLIMFSDALKALLVAAEKAEKEKSTAKELEAALLNTTSLNISSRMVAREEKKKKQKQMKKQ